MSARKEPEAEMMEVGGVLRSLCYLAKTVRQAAQEVARGIESVAWTLDRERRGALSVGARQDNSEVAETIKSLLTDPLLSDDDRSQLRNWIREEIDPEFRAKQEQKAPSAPAPKALRARR